MSDHMSEQLASWSHGQAVTPEFCDCIDQPCRRGFAHKPTAAEPAPGRHSSDCGTLYRGCAPYCEKDLAERLPPAPPAAEPLADGRDPDAARLFNALPALADLVEECERWAHVGPLGRALAALAARLNGGT